MSAISEFLRARYAERRELALAATPGPWTAEIEFYTPREPLLRLMPQEANSSPPGYFAVRPVAELEGNGDGGVLTAADAEYIAAHGPDAILADLDAKLAILDEHPDVNDGNCGTCVTGHWGYPTHGGSSPQRYPCRTLRLLAVPFAAHPDYDEKWRP